MVTKRKPCPMCGGEQSMLLQTHLFDGVTRDTFRVECANEDCRCRTRPQSSRETALECWDSQPRRPGGPGAGSAEVAAGLGKLREARCSLAALAEVLPDGQTLSAGERWTLVGRAADQLREAEELLGQAVAVAGAARVRSPEEEAYSPGRVRGAVEVRG